VQQKISTVQESLVKAFQVTAASLVTLLAASSYAQSVPGPTARAEVKAETLRAAAAGELLPPSGFGPLTRSYWRISTVPRSEVAAQVLAASASQSLQPPGEATMADRQVVPASALARADVKADVLAARADGSLAPAGDAYDGASSRRARPIHSWGSLAAKNGGGTAGPVARSGNP
jgi:hypothetical protein